MTRGSAYLTAGLVAMATPVSADWGAVAVNKDARAFGYTNLKSSRGAADRRALQHCQRFSEGKKGCKVVLSTKKCFAVIRHGSEFFVEVASTKSRAARRVAAACKAKHGSACRPVGKHQHCASGE